MLFARLASLRRPSFAGVRCARLVTVYEACDDGRSGTARIFATARVDALDKASILLRVQRHGVFEIDVTRSVCSRCSDNFWLNSSARKKPWRQTKPNAHSLSMRKALRAVNAELVQNLSNLFRCGNKVGSARHDVHRSDRLGFGQRPYMKF